jgi:hypothetical protein
MTMSGYLLTDEEKHRFSQWLQLQIESCKAMSEQMEKMAGPVGEQLAKRERLKVAAFTLVYREINSGETMEISR